MKLRRKIFSSFIDEYGEERYFSVVGEDMISLMRKGAGMTEDLNREAYRDAEIENKTKRGIEEAKQRMQKAQEEAAKAGQPETLSKTAREGANLSRKGAGMDKIDSPAEAKVKETTGKAKAWLKKTYGKGAKHRGLKIAGTAAVPVLATGAVVTTKAVKAKKARQQETNEK